MGDEIQFRNVSLGEQTWRYYELGSGRPVILLHGFPDTPHSYLNIAQALKQDGYRAIVPYLRGYHRDTLVEGRAYDPITIGEDAIRLLDALKLDSAVLVGHDWGASIVYAAAAIAPKSCGRRLKPGRP